MGSAFIIQTAPRQAIGTRNSTRINHCLGPGLSAPNLGFLSAAREKVKPHPPGEM